MNNKILETELIILKKFPYTESSLIMSGLSPLYGKIDFILKGARKLTNKKYETPDLLNIIEIKFLDKNEGLIAPKQTEIIRTFNHLSGNLEILSSIFDQVQLILKNKHHGIHSKLLYSIFIKYLDSLDKETKIPSFFVKLALLYEDGLLPEISNSENKNNVFVKNLLLYICHHGDLPKSLNNEYIENLKEWILSL